MWQLNGSWLGSWKKGSWADLTVGKMEVVLHGVEKILWGIRDLCSTL